MKKHLTLLLVAFIFIFVASGTTHASTLLYWNYENFNFESVAQSFNPEISGISDTTWGASIESWSPIDGPNLLITRWFGDFHPFITFTTTNDMYLGGLSFYDEHNHNVHHPTYPNYDGQLQFKSGTYSWTDSDYTDIGAQFEINPDLDWTFRDINLGNQLLSAGTYTIRWDSRNVSWGDDTGSEFYGLDGVTLKGNVVPEPTTMLLLGTGLIGLAGIRRKMKK
jgi:hypothetical protein